MVPGYVNDGDFTIAQQNGAPVYSFPFAENGDMNTAVVNVSMRAAVEDYEPPVPMTSRWFDNLGECYLVNFTNPRMNGQGLLDWEENYANLPITRREFEPVTYTAQQFIGGTLTSFTDTYDGIIVYEYSLFQPLPQLRYARMIVVNAIGTPTVQIVGDPIPAVPGLALASNSTSKRWMGEIYERKSPLVNFTFPQNLLTP